MRTVALGVMSGNTFHYRTRGDNNSIYKDKALLTSTTLPRLFQQKGYETSAYGKWHFGCDYQSRDGKWIDGSRRGVHFGRQNHMIDFTKPVRKCAIDVGFDYFFGISSPGSQYWLENRLPVGKITVRKAGEINLFFGEHWNNKRVLPELTKRIVKRIGEYGKQKGEKPFFLYYAMLSPHDPYTPNDAFIGKSKAGLYGDYVFETDWAVGEVVKALEANGLAENTVVIFASDNGPTYARVGGADSEFFNSAGPLRGLKGSVYEGGIRVPMIVRWPGKVKANSISQHVSYFPDFFNTLSEVAGITDQYQTDGVSFLPEILGEEGQQDHEFLYWEFPSYGGQQAIRYGKWKGVRKGLFKDHSAPLELYDLDKDIGETTDLAAKYPEIINTMDSLMKSARFPSEIFPFEALDNN